MGTILNFNQEYLDEAEAYYKTMHVAADQTSVITQMAQFLSQFLPLNERSIKGFMWRVFKDWQLKHKRDIKDLLTASPEERLQITAEILGMLKGALTRVLISQEQVPLLDEAFKKATDFYKEQFSKR